MDQGARAQHRRRLDLASRLRPGPHGDADRPRRA